MALSDAEAIEQAMMGHSTKPSKERGYGLRTSKRLVCEGLQGEFILLSGTAFLYSDPKSDMIVPLADFCWKGAVVAYRIPRPDKPIDIYQYLE